jgi:DNA polymerase-3 subunit gamma/tau
MYISLYRRYRPDNFQEVVGQEGAVKLLKGSVLRKNVSHAYLFSGPRGSGKTTLARILAKAVNCLDPASDGEPCGRCSSCVSITSGESLDVIEIDGASNNGVDEVRELKSHVNLSPFSSRYKIYIIDEVHMLSISAFNALLKTLEEPPGYVIFVLATTEPHKVPVTIRSRCQHVPFHRISEKEISGYLPVIAEKEGRIIDREACFEIARQSDGSLRDALSILEQAMSASEGDIKSETISLVLSGGSYADMERLIKSCRVDETSALTVIEDILSRGASPSRVLEYLYLLSRNLWIAARWGERTLESIDLTEEEIAFVSSEKEYWNEKGLLELMDFCLETIQSARNGMRSDVLAGLVFSKLTVALKIRGKAGIDEDAPKQINEPDEHPEKKKDFSFSTNNADFRKDLERSSSQAALEGQKSEDPEKFPEPENSGVKTIEDPSGAGASAMEGVDLSRLMDSLSESSLNIYACLISAGIYIEGEAIVVEFGSEQKSCYAIMSSPGNAYKLQEAIESIFKVCFPLIVRYRDKEVSFPSSGGEEDAAANVFAGSEFPGSSQESLFSDQDKGWENTGNADLDSEASIVNKKPSAEEEISKDNGFAGVLSDVIKITNGEILYVKDQDMPETEVTEQNENGE